MIRSRLEELAGALTLASKTIRDCLGEKPPEHYRSSLAVLPDAPSELAELPEWFERLPLHQIRTVWVAAIIACVADDLSATGETSIKDLMAAMVAVRSCYDRHAGVLHETTPASAPSGMLPPFAAIERTAVPMSPASAAPTQEPVGSHGSVRRAIIDLARATAPNPGDSFVIVDVFPDQTNYAARLLRESNDFEVRASATGRGRGWPRAVAVRKAVTQ